jgi:hypothetical protein
MEYGLLASKSSEFIGSILWNLKDAWNSTPWWMIVAFAVGILLIWRILFRTR